RAVGAGDRRAGGSGRGAAALAAARGAARARTVQHRTGLAAGSMNVGTLLELVLLLAPLSLVAVGGINAVLPEIHRQAVQQYGWLTDSEFADLFAIAQAAPGQSMVLLVGLIG